MCIALWALDCHEYALILCSNRDEFLNRPTQAAHFHNFEKNETGSDSGNILSGRDEKAGGTWFGVNRAGKVALLTNITEPLKTYPSSRGYLTSSFLLSDASLPLEAEVGRIIPQGVIGGFNLILLGPAPRPDGSLYFDSLWVTNNGAGGNVTSRPLSSGEQSCGCVSNAVEGTNPPWPKVDHATQEFSRLLHDISPSTSEAELTDKLFEILSWRSPRHITDRAELLNTVHVAPLPIAQDTSPNGSNLYATRLSTVMLVKKSGEALFVERDIWQLVDGEPVRAEPWSRRIFRFRVDSQGSASKCD